MVNRGVELTLSGNADCPQGLPVDGQRDGLLHEEQNHGTLQRSTEYELSNTSKKLVVGHDVGEFYINRFAGVNPANGDALWYTKDGALTTELRDEDKVMIGRACMPRGKAASARRSRGRGLSLTAQFSWVADRWMINNDRYFNESNGRFASNNQSRRLLERWKNRAT